MSYADRVKETTTTTGVNDLTLAGAVTAYRSCSSAFAIGQPFRYCVVGGTEWEVGQGYLSTPTTLVRQSVSSSSNSGELVSFSAGSKDVFCTIPAIAVCTPGNLLAKQLGMAMP